LPERLPDLRLRYFICGLPIAKATGHLDPAGGRWAVSAGRAGGSFAVFTRSQCLRRPGAG